MEDSDKKLLMTFLAPYFAGLIIVSIFLTLVCIKYIPIFRQIANPSVVVFDINKYVNAQRKVASVFLGDGSTDRDLSGANETLSSVSKRTQDAIKRIAGANTLVVIKQAVVEGTTLDITDDVLRELGLPTDAPTQDPTKAYLDPYPTQSRLVDGPVLKPPQKTKEQEQVEADAAKSSVSDKKVPVLP